MKKYLQWRTYRALFLKLMRTQASPASLARGVALGLFIGFLIPMGLQILVVLPLAFLLKAAKIPAVAFTFVTNHVTVFFIYPVQCWVGSYLMFNPISLQSLEAQLDGLIHAPDMQTAMVEVARMGLQLGGAFFLGGALFGVIAGVIGYICAYQAAVRFRAKLAARRASRVKVQKS